MGANDKAFMAAAAAAAVAASGGGGSGQPANGSSQAKGGGGWNTARIVTAAQQAMAEERASELSRVAATLRSERDEHAVRTAHAERSFAVVSAEAKAVAEAAQQVRAKQITFPPLVMPLPYLPLPSLPPLVVPRGRRCRVPSQGRQR